MFKKRYWWQAAKCEQFIAEDELSLPPEEHLGAHFIWTQWKKPEIVEELQDFSHPKQRLMYNKMEDNFHLANKKALFMNMVSYYKRLDLDPFEVAIPLTFHIKSSCDKEYNELVEVYQRHQEIGKSNVWIIKPGENSNRGCGIEVADNLKEIKQHIDTNARMTNRTSIVQLYIERPLLISGRKFDIRAFALVTQTNRAIKGYFYRDCYFRTSSRPFDIHNFDKFIHLTNDAVQVNSDDYGKYENANKMSIHDF